MRKLHIDFEARSEVDLKLVGAYKYAAHPSTEILCMAYAIDDRPTKIIKYGGDFTVIYDYMQMVMDGEMVCTAFNAFFERCIFKFKMQDYFVGFEKPEYWQCTMAKACQAGMTGSLDVVCQLLKMKDVKDKEGKRVMMKMCKPRKPLKKERDDIFLPDVLWHETPEDFEILYKYCIKDVDVERGIDRRLPNLPPAEQKIWQIYQRKNDTGIPVNMPQVHKAIRLMEQQKLDANNEMQTLTEYRVDAVTKVAKIKKELERYNVKVDSIAAGVISDLIDSDIPEKAKEILRLRRDNGKSSTAKYEAIRSREYEGRTHGMFSYHHATTGRWGSRGIQLHNLPRGNIKDVDTALFAFMFDALWMYTPLPSLLSSLIRTCFIASEGYDLVAADYAAIEARVLAWLAGQHDVVQKFHDGVDLYVDMAKSIFNKEVISKDERFIAKQTFLGSGYGMGGHRHNEQLKGYGVTLTEEFSDKCIKTYRKDNPKVVKFWYGVERMIRNAIKKPGTVYHCNGIYGKVGKNFLRIKLLSGRLLYYYKPHFDDENSIRFWGFDSQTHRIQQQYSYGAKFVENIVQATARDILANALVTLEGTKYQSILHVHDEVVSLVKEGQGDVDEYCQMVATLPDWAKGCPTKAEGWTGKYYKKD